MAHIHEKIDLVAEAIIVEGDAVLLRKHEKYDLWTGVGGHIEPDEDPNEAVLREVKEEVGLDVELISEEFPFEDLPGERELIAPRFMNRHRINDAHEHVSLVFFARARSRETVENEEQKSKGLRWLTKEDLMDPRLDIHPHIRHYALTALAELGGQ